MKRSLSLKKLILLGLFVVSGLILIISNTFASGAKKAVSARPPKDVRGFRAVSRTSDSVSLSWKESKDADGYLIYIYSEDGKKWVRAAKTADTSVKISNLPSGENCSFLIRSYKRTDGSFTTSKGSAKIRICTLLREVAGVGVKPSFDRVRLSWTRDPQADGYIIYKYNTDISKWERVIKILSDADSFTFSGLEENTRLAFAVKAFKRIGRGETYSESSKPIKTRTVMHSVTGLKLIMSSDCARFSWDSAQGIESYYIFPAVPTKYSVSVPDVPIASTEKTSYIFSNLKAGVRYRFSVAGRRTGRGYDRSYTVDCTLPKSVHLEAVKDGGNITLSWNERREADDYVIYIKLPDEDWKEIGHTQDLSFTFADYGAEKYYAAVRSRINRKGILLYSDSAKLCIRNTDYAGSVYSCGDSVALGKGADNYSYISQFAEKNNLSLKNSAIGGAALSSYPEKCDCIAEIVIDEISAGYDYIVLEGGLNDYYYSSPLGEITPDGTADFDMNTTCGALEAMLSHVKSTCADSKVYFVSVHRIESASQPNKLGLTYNDYREAINKICRKYGVTLIDCYGSGFDPSLTYTREGICPDGDGVHPTSEGYEKYYLPLLDEKIELNN